MAAGEIGRKGGVWATVALAVGAAGALGLALFGYGLLGGREASGERELRNEALEIVDRAQLWYLSPRDYGGGGRSFVGLDFRRLGLEPDSGAVHHRGRFGSFTLEPGDQTFDLIAVSGGGVTLEFRGVEFDALPEPERR